MVKASTLLLRCFPLLAAQHVHLDIHPAGPDFSKLYPLKESFNIGSNVYSLLQLMEAGCRQIIYLAHSFFRNSACSLPDLTFKQQELLLRATVGQSRPLGALLEQSYSEPCPFKRGLVLLGIQL